MWLELVKEKFTEPLLCTRFGVNRCSTCGKCYNLFARGKWRYRVLSLESLHHRNRLMLLAIVFDRTYLAMGATLGIAGLATLILACCVWQSTERPRITSNHWFSNSTLLNPSGVTYLRFSPCARPGAVPGEGENKSVPAILRTFQFSVG